MAPRTHHHHRRDRRRRRAPFEPPTLTEAAAAVAAAAALVLASQALYVGLSTPRLPPPDRSGHDFEEDGLVAVGYEDEHEQQEEEDGDEGDASTSDRSSSSSSNDRSKSDPPNKEFRLVLLGDSPVEGIGNDHHHEALGGQTALSFSRTLRRPVRYWSFGRSGLTAGGIEREMVPLLRRAVERYGGVDAVVISCGVNNVLWGQSAGTFGAEVESLLNAVEGCCRCCCEGGSGEDEEHRARPTPAIIMMGLLDFSHMPFLPWPLSSVAGWRSRALQRMMEEVVARRQQQKQQGSGGARDNDNVEAGSCCVCFAIAHMPEVATVLDGSRRHPLLDHLDHTVIPDLTIDDFFADDGFHPAGHGTAMLGNLLARTYGDMVGIMGCDPPVMN